MGELRVLPRLTELPDEAALLPDVGHGGGVGGRRVVSVCVCVWWGVLRRARGGYDVTEGQGVRGRSVGRVRKLGGHEVEIPIRGVLHGAVGGSVYGDSVGYHSEGG